MRDIATGRVGWGTAFDLGSMLLPGSWSWADEAVEAGRVTSAGGRRGFQWGDLFNQPLGITPFRLPGKRTALDEATEQWINSSIEINNALAEQLAKDGRIERIRVLEAYNDPQLLAAQQELGSVNILLRGQIRLPMSENQSFLPIQSGMIREFYRPYADQSYQFLRDVGLTDEQIARITTVTTNPGAFWDAITLKGKFEWNLPLTLPARPYGSLGIPTTRLPYVATAYAPSDGGIYIIRSNQAIIPESPTYYGIEMERVILNEIPASDIIAFIPSEDLGLYLPYSRTGWGFSPYVSNSDSFFMFGPAKGGE
jgi:hypothetical protein